MFFVVGLTLSHYWDVVERRRCGRVPLCGLDGPFRYQLLVVTGKLPAAGESFVLLSLMLVSSVDFLCSFLHPAISSLIQSALHYTSSYSSRYAWKRWNANVDNRRIIDSDAHSLYFVTNNNINISIIITSLSKVIWEEGRVAALSHTYAVKSPLVTMARPKFAPKSIPSFHGPIPNPHYMPHPLTRPTYDAKRHPDPIRRFPQCTGQTDAPTDGQIVHGKVWSL